MQMNIESVKDRAASFETIMSRVNGYGTLQIDEWENDLSLILLEGGEIAIVFCRYQGILKRFNRDKHFSGGHWSDVDIDNAIYS